jgi:predicted nucleic-acid-binding protein
LGGRTLKITADTNVLVRAAVGDDPAQSAAAAEALRAAALIAVTIPVLCEFVWVLSRAYKFSKPDIGAAIRRLLGTHTVLADRAAAEAGLAFLEAGGDFADGVIAFLGAHAGAEVFLSFDKQAVALATGLGISAQSP